MAESIVCTYGKIGLIDPAMVCKYFDHYLSKCFSLLKCVSNPENRIESVRGLFNCFFYDRYKSLAYFSLIIKLLVNYPDLKENFKDQFKCLFNQFLAEAPDVINHILSTMDLSTQAELNNTILNDYNY